jgi:hypothetical protein
VGSMLYIAIYFAIFIVICLSLYPLINVLTGLFTKKGPDPIHEQNKEIIELLKEINRKLDDKNV